MILMDILNQNKSVFFTLNVSKGQFLKKILTKYFQDVAQSTLNLTSLDVPDGDKKDQKRKTSRISKGIMDFISMGDTIGYADKKINK